MSDHEPVITADADVFVVRTPRGWILTLPDRREPAPVDDATMHALLRISGGATLGADDPARAELEAIGFPLRPAGEVAASVGDVARGPVGGRSGLDPEILAPLPGAWVRPLPAFLAQVTAGALVIEGLGGKRQVLDEIDLMLIEAIEGECAVADVVEAVTAKLGDDAPSGDELGRRVRSIAAVGRLQFYDGVRPEPPVMVATPPEPESEVEVEGPDVSPAPPSSRPAWTRTPFPGRRRLGRAYRRLRAALDPDRRGPATTAMVQEEPPGERAAAPEDRLGMDQPSEVDAAPEGEDGEWETGLPPTSVVYRDTPVVGPVADGAIPVYSVFQVETGPQLSLAMLTACARAYDDGVLNQHYEIRRIEDPASFLADQAGRGPAVLLLSNYVWCVDHNLELARRAKAENPELVVIHGGPSSPKYEVQCEEWFETHGAAVDVVVRGEGEITLAEALKALSSARRRLDLASLASVDGLTFRHPADGSIVRNPDRERLADLDVLPSPYLTGELDHLDPSAWVEVVIEASRGCPYGCTFCDWGSGTMSRVRKFDIDRVAGEMDWAGQRKFHAWAMGDANFGIASRDVDVAKRIAEVKQRWGWPRFLGFNVAKNTTKHLTAIVDELVRAGVGPVFSLALQTRDEDTLEAIRRTNISTDHYIRLAASMRRRGLPIQADIMLGLPGQTVESLLGDMQFLSDHEVPVRMWITHLLPNAPINDPEYREEWQVEANEQGVVVSTRSFTAADRAQMIRLRHSYTVFEQFGLLRHVLRYVQWDHGVPRTSILQRIVTVSHEDPNRYPLLNWTMRYFDYFNVPPLGWNSFFDEVRRFLVNEFDVSLTAALDSVLDLQAHLLPEIGRSFPSTITLRHDYVDYFQQRTRPLWLAESPAATGPRLEESGPALFTVYADPLSRCSTGTINVVNDPRNEAMTDDFWMAGHWEMDSPLVVSRPQVAGSQRFIGLFEQVPDDLPAEPEATSRAAVRVALARSSVRAVAGDDVDPG